ncbi:MAG: TIGR00266 family protein [Candidatus Margulisbacteria bacterium GWF2_35_9]|nr:MAG: TIGR00266 family protein [Candidatus Margulisbacteria bacterium GWF2_35_9]
MKCHEVDYKIVGDDLQFVEVELDPKETVIAEAGAMMYMEEGISYEAKMGDGSNPVAGFWDKAMQAGKRLVSGESLFITHFTNHGSGKQKVAFSSAMPGKIVAIDMGKIKKDIICQKDSFLCAALGTKLDIAFQKRLGVGFFGGEGFILQRITGDGMLFINAGGTVIEKELNGETLRIDTGCIVAFEDGINYDIQAASSLKSMVFGGEGIFLATLSGKGRVWLQSLPFSRLADNVIAHAPRVQGSSQGEGSLLGTISNIFEKRF